MRMIGTWLCAAVVLLSSGAAWATPESESLKLLAGVHLNTTTASLNVQNPGPSLACFYSLITFDPTTATGRLLYATALEALSTDATVTVNYERNGTGCVLTQISILP